MNTHNVNPNNEPTLNDGDTFDYDFATGTFTKVLPVGSEPAQGAYLVVDGGGYLYTKNNPYLKVFSTADLKWRKIEDGTNTLESGRYTIGALTAAKTISAHSLEDNESANIVDVDGVFGTFPLTLDLGGSISYIDGDGQPATATMPFTLSQSGDDYTLIRRGNDWQLDDDAAIASSAANAELPRRTYAADGAISDEDQKAVFYSSAVMAMTINSATDRQIVLIRSGDFDVTITDAGGKLFRHENPDNPGMVLPDETSITLNTNSTWTADFDTALDRWVISDGDTSGASVTGVFGSTYTLNGDVHTYETTDGFVRMWGDAASVDSLTLPVAVRDINDCDIHITTQGTAERHVHPLLASSTNTSLALVRIGNTGATFLWSVFGEAA